MSLSVSSDYTKISGSPSDSMTKRSEPYSGSDASKVGYRANDWWSQYASALKTTPQKIWSNVNKSASLKEIDALPHTIENDVGSYDKAVGVANYLGGGGVYNGFFQKTPCWADSSDYLNPDKITTEGTVSPYNVGELLLTLKKNNPAAHSYIVEKAISKAKHVAGTLDSVYGFTDTAAAKEVGKATKVIIDAAKNIIHAAEDVVEGAGNSLGVAGWIMKNIIWIAPVTIAGVGYLIYRNRHGIIEIAKVATPQGRMLAAAQAIQKNAQEVQKNKNGYTVLKPTKR